MQTIKIDLNKVTAEQIDLIVDYLKRGLVIAYPTDTIYGLGCDARDASAIKKIKKIKERKRQKNNKALLRQGFGGQAKKQENKSMIVLVSDFTMLRHYCEVSEEQMEYLKKVWGINPPHPPLQGGQNSPVTVILENRRNLPAELTVGLESLAVRLPANEFLVKMISTAGFPVVSTSLNETGEPPLSSGRGLEKYFDVLPDLAIDAGECQNTRPSRLVDLREIENIKVIRE